MSPCVVSDKHWTLLRHDPTGRLVAQQSCGRAVELSYLR